MHHGVPCAQLIATLKTDMSAPLASMGDLLSVIGVCVSAKDSTILLPYFPNASGGASQQPSHQQADHMRMDSFAMPSRVEGARGVVCWRASRHITVTRMWNVEFLV